MAKGRIAAAVVALLACAFGVICVSHAQSEEDRRGSLTSVVVRNEAAAWDAKGAIEAVQKLFVEERYAEVKREARALVDKLERAGRGESVDVARLLDLLVEARLRIAGSEQPGGEPLRPLAERAVWIKRSLLPPGDPEIATSLINLGAVLLGERQADEAKALFKEALSIRENAFGGRHPVVAEACHYLALALVMSGHDVEALAQLERALDIWEASFGPEHASLLPVLSVLGDVTRDLGEYDVAARCYGRLLTIMTRTWGGDHPRTLAARNRLASLLLALGDLDGAAAIGVGSLEQLVKLQPRLGPGHGATWHRSYEKGEQALREQDWRGVVRHMLVAVEARAQPESQAITPQRTAVNYHPYLRLGIAFYNLGEFARALTALDGEERLGAIADSPHDLKNLLAFRQLARRAANAGGPNPAGGSVADVIERSLRDAQDMERDGRLDDALGALSRALALAPDDAQVNTAMTRLRQRIGARERERELDRRVGEMVSDGATLLAAGRYEEASAVLSQAQSLDPSPRVKELLDRSQAKLSEQIQAARDAESRRVLVRDVMAEVEKLEREGHVTEALARLQSALAADPRNEKALTARDRLLEQEAGAEVARSTGETIARLVAEGSDLLERGDNTQAADRFSRVLALDPADATAQHSLRAALGGMAEALTGRAPGSKIPPMIVLANVTDGNGADDVPEERTDAPRVTLAGVIDADRPEIELTIRRLNTGSPDDGEAVHRAVLTSDSRRGSLHRYRFRHTVELRPGPASFAIAASDADGMGDEVIHHVRYVRPWTRSPWFHGSLVLILAGGFAATRGYRVHRRRRLLRRRFNPYAAGAPILDDELFFGREALLARVLQTIPNNSIALYGERRIGKTSLQHQLRKRLQQMNDPVYEFHPVYIDLEGTPQDHFFHTLGHEIFEALAPRLDDKKVGSALADGAPYDYQAFVKDIRWVLEALRRQSGKKIKLVLLLDEVDELNEYDPRINQRLRSLFMKSFAEELVAVVSGVGIRKTWEREGSPWFNFFEEIPVQAFEKQHARELIERPVRGVFEFEDGVVDQIIERAACKPYLIQKTCVELVNRMHETGRRRITRQDVEGLGPPAP